MNRRACLQILGTVGEPINPEAWRWYEEVVGEGNCPIVDTWWQTETGGHMITPLPGAWAEKPGSATLPFFGVLPAILDPESGKELEGEAEGVLCIKQVPPSPVRACMPDCLSLTSGAAHPCQQTHKPASGSPTRAGGRNTGPWQPLAGSQLGAVLCMLITGGASGGANGGWRWCADEAGGLAVSWLV